MSKCLECQAEISQTPGRRPRKFCDNKGKCRLAHWNKNNPKEGKYGQSVMDTAEDLKRIDEIEQNLKLPSKYLSKTRKVKLENELKQLKEKIKN